MTLIVIAIAATVLFAVGRSSAALSGSSGAMRRRHVRTIALAGAALLFAIFMMKGAGFVAGIGLVLPFAAIALLAALGLGIAQRFRMRR